MKKSSVSVPVAKLTLTTLTLATLALVFAFSSPAFAKQETKAMLSKSCSAEAVRKLNAAAIVKVEAGVAANTFNVTLDTAKMSWIDLTKKMATAGCFN